MATETISVTTDRLPNMWVASIVLAKLCLGPTCSVSVPLKYAGCQLGVVRYGYHYPCVSVCVCLYWSYYQRGQ